ncbi:MAG: DUF4830 domain-containing protein [Clostridia bacterium]|nr:DUF4830 domain-containing protein [Clostridia bacterium]
MFVYSVKTSKSKIAAFAIAIVAVVIAIAMILTDGKEPAANDSAVNCKASDSAERAAFLSQFGWKISQDPVEISEVIIPEDFDAGYAEYAAMNKAQGFELEPYKGMRAKRWTYDVLNYPGLENLTGTVQANLLIYDGRVIGGDICSLEQGGFIHGFELPEDAVPQTTAPPVSALTSEIADEN